MTFSSMLVLSAILIGATVLIIFLMMVKTGGDKKKLEAVPIRLPLITVAACCLLGTGAMTVLTNQDAAREAESQRAYAAFVQIEAESTLGMGTDPAGSPFMDVSAGGNDWGDDALRHALGTGEEIQLKTSSGKPATLKLIGSGSNIDSFTPAFTYDGEEIGWGRPDTVKVHNTKGFPQFMEPASLPAS